MPQEISKVKLPSGSEYQFKDLGARELIADITSGSAYLGVTTTPLTDGASTNPITISGESVTAVTGNIVNYGSKEFIFSSTSIWQEFGDLSQLGDLAFKDTASGSGSVAVPKTYSSTFTGTAATGTISGTAAAQTFSGTEATLKTTSEVVTNVTFSGSATTSTGNFTPQGTIGTGTGTSNYTPSGSISVGTGTANYTPQGTVSAPTISVSSAGATGSVTQNTFAVENEVLKIGQTSTNVKTGDASYSASQPTFTGTGKELKFTGTGTQLVFNGTSGSVSVSGTSQGSLNQTKSKVNVTDGGTGTTYTPEGTNASSSVSGSCSITATGSVSTSTATTENKTVSVTVS